MNPRSGLLLPLVLAVASSLGALPARAEIWGYVGEDGLVYISDHQVNERYRLFRKDPPKSEPMADEPAGSVAAMAAREMPADVPARYRELLAQTARDYGLDAALLHAIISVESGYNPAAVSPRGAVGLMQVLPDTAARFGVTELKDPAQNLRAGARYLKALLELFDRDLELVLAAYNAGEGAVMRFGNSIPPYPETRDYVPRVLSRYRGTRM